MLSVKVVLVLNLVTIVICTPVLETLHEENEVLTALDKELLRSKKSLDVKGIKSALNDGKVLPDQKDETYDVSKKHNSNILKQQKNISKSEDDYKKNEYLVFKPVNNRNENDETDKENNLEDIDTISINPPDEIISNIEYKMKNIIEQQNNDMIDKFLDDNDLLNEDLKRSPRQYMNQFPQKVFNGVISPLIPVQMDSRYGPLNNDGLNYVPVNPEQIKMYVRQGVAIKDDLNKKFPVQGAANVIDPQSRNPLIPIPVIQYGSPHHQQQQQPSVIVIQPIVIPAHKEEKEEKQTAPVIKDKHPRIEIPKHPPIKLPEKPLKPTALNTPLIPSLLTTILPALIPLLVKKKDESKKKPVIYMSKQFLINPNVVPSITLPIPKQLPTTSVTIPSSDKPTSKEVEAFLNDVTGNNATMSQGYLKSAIENEELRLANLQKGNTDSMVGHTRAQVPAEFRGRLLKRVAELDTEVGVLTEQLSQLQRQQNLAHAIAATLN